MDDVFPNLLTAFRVAEYNYYLDSVPDAEVHSTMRFPTKTGSMEYASAWAEYHEQFPDKSNRLHPYRSADLPSATLAYMVFLNNAFAFVSEMERLNIPFVFTLYPGGGFKLNDPISDLKLKRVFASPCFRKVILTQRTTLDYIVGKSLCDAGQVAFIFGTCISPDQFSAVSPPRKIYRADKPTVDIAFVANKYTIQGKDKGYDTFITVAQILARTEPNLRFHVVGPFAATDFPLDDLASRITFHGPQHRAFFFTFYPFIDLILSPNIPFVLAPGAFDGFPTGCCVEAALAGVPVFATDSLGENHTFVNGHDMVIISCEAARIAQQVQSYLNHYDKLLKLGHRGQAAFRRVYSPNAQLMTRFKILDEFLNKDN